jgi:secreted trypsin-like serine protease
MLALVAIAQAVAAPIVGGHDAAAGAWPDAVAVLVGGALHCGGVLVAPDVVVTAGHCLGMAGSSLDPPPDHVLIGATRLSQPGDGETVAVATAIAHPDVVHDLDVGVLILAQPSTRAPRTLATGWAAAEQYAGAAVTIVGWGVTSPAGTTASDAQQEATIAIVEASCASTALGCRAALMPGGELRAGGAGTDACYGDSGGPLYVRAADGTYLGATTYAGYVSPGATCGDGGIYERADRAIAWIEQASGRALPRAAAPTADPIEVVEGERATTTVVANDPRAGASHTFAIAVAPAHGEASVDAGGVVTFEATGAAGADQIVVAVADGATPARQVAFAIAVTIAPGGSGCGCGAGVGGAGGGRSAVAPALALLAAWTWRRRSLRRPRRAQAGYSRRHGWDHLDALQRLQARYLVRRRALGVQRIHLQPRAHEARLLQRRLLGQPRRDAAPPRRVGRRGAGAVGRGVGRGVGARAGLAHRR